MKIGWLGIILILIFVCLCSGCVTNHPPMQTEIKIEGVVATVSDHYVPGGIVSIDGYDVKLEDGNILTFKTFPGSSFAEGHIFLIVIKNQSEGRSSLKEKARYQWLAESYQSENGETHWKFVNVTEIHS
jgi:hypothetical protein